MEKRAQRSLDRLLPRLEALFDTKSKAKHWPIFAQRLTQNFEPLFSRLLHLYGDQYDFFYHLEAILSSAAEMWLARPADLKALDAAREAQPNWFQAEKMMGGVCYVDLFAGDFAGVRQKIPYFKELGLTYLHLMPLFDAPAGNSDGGYAVSSYRHTNPVLGSMAELAELAAELRQEGISLVLDFIYNHTSDEHIWAKKALAGNPDYQDYYYIFPNRTMPDAYDAHLREIFPDQRAGSFSYRPEIDSWVWTTFNDFQWDLNYSNPAVFNSMAQEMLFLANQGAEVLRLDAVAFAWKKLGTTSESLPEVHLLVQAFNSLARLAAPALIFKSEAIVHPQEVNSYIDPGECQTSYNPLLMALLWESLATRKVALLNRSLQTYFNLPAGCAWVNYVRSHDDIGWTFSDEDAGALGINGYDHRRFLNAFYTGRFEGSFARGLPFQENPRTGDARISGTCASLAGLEQAIYEGEPDLAQLAIGRILLIHSIILSIGGIPLLYLGDEVGTLNDYNYRNHPAKAGDSRWVHRPASDWEQVALREDRDTYAGQIFQQLQALIRLRQKTAAFAGGETQFINTENPHVFAYARHHQGERVLVLANFSEHSQRVGANLLRTQGLSYHFEALVTGESVSLGEDVVLGGYQFLWLRAV